MQIEKIKLKSLQIITTICSTLAIASNSAAANNSRSLIGKDSKHSTLQSQSSQDFLTDPVVRNQMKFWETIFQKYDANSVVIHDVDEPLALVDVINFSSYRKDDGNFINVASSEQSDLVKKYIQRYDLAVLRFSKVRERALEYGAIEKRLFEVYQRDPILLSKLYSGNVRFRGQAGLSDTFLKAAKRAQEYLPYMEKSFATLGVPKKLTRLPFVESMFNLSAKSKVGASGIWQFMPDTAREYMAVNSMIDERNNPYKATIAAARLLQGNYQELGTWPLAITAYNHGRGGIQKAAKELGTRQLGTIISSYKSPSFGFASKNFYAEFMAASSTYDLLVIKGQISPTNERSKVDIFSLTRPLSIKEISEKTNLSYSVLAQLNPCLNQTAFTNRSNTPLPQNFLLRLPRENSTAMRKKRLVSLANPATTLVIRR